MLLCNFLNMDEIYFHFRSRYVFALLKNLHAEKELEWHYNEAHHGKGPMDGIGGTIKNKVFREVKSGRIVIDSPKSFTDAANLLVPSVSTLYLPQKDVIEETPDVADAPYIKGTLDIHKILRRKSAKGVTFLEFFKLSFDNSPFFTQYYRSLEDPIVCGHRPYSGSSDNCAHCMTLYGVGEEAWMQCPACCQWYCGEDCFAK